MIVAGSTNPLLLASAGGYNLTRSLRFRSSASAYLNRTPASAGNQKTWTFSFWVKRGILSSFQYLYGVGGGSNDSTIAFYSDDSLAMYLNDGAGSTGLRTTQVFRDPSAWYHIIIAMDTTQATASNRMKMYVNGSQVTAFQNASYPNQNTDWQVNTSSYAATIGRGRGGSYSDCYMAEYNFIDGQALTPSSFGETSTTTGVWQPIEYAGTYGTNGFYLPFTDNSALTTSSNVGLGKDFSGNGNYWTTNNISITAGSTYDSMTDVPTLTSATASNFATFNPILYMGTGSTKSYGNLRFAGGGSGGPPYNYSIYGTFTQNTGKWYWETTITTAGNEAFVGMFNTAINFTGTSLQSSAGPVLYGYDGNYYNETSPVSFGATYTTGDVIGVAVDYDNNLIWFSKNGTFQNSGVPATGTNGKSFGSGKTWGTGYVESGSSASPSTFDINFGQRPFAYTPPTGYVALNTFNLPTPTIGATASSQANKYFDATLYTGNGSSQSIVNSGGFAPSMVWQKDRTQALGNMLFDTIRGAGKFLFSDSTSAEGNEIQTLSSFNSNGFSVGSNGHTNSNGDAYVAWQWKANGTGVTNTAGSITSTVSANTTAGFSVVTYTGNASVASFGHGLGVAPKMIIIKNRSASGSGSNWCVGIQIDGWNWSTDYLYLNTTAAKATDGGTTQFYSAPTSTVVNIGGGTNTNGSGNSMVAYCFSEVAGYSKFGSYTGNGSSTDGPFVYTGFRPRYIMFKGTSLVSSWLIYDTARSTINPVPANGGYLLANSSAAEAGTGDSAAYVDILSNGFKIRNNSGFDNASGSDTYIYMAFAENPFKYSLAR